MDDNRGGRTNAAEAALSVAVIGPRTMGAAVTRRLLGAGLAVNVWGRQPRRALDLAEAGAIVFDDPKDAVSTASVVLTWLPTAAAVDDVMVGLRVLDAMAPRAVWAQMGTIGVEATERLGAYAAVRRPDVGFVDAPVSGSRNPAQSGRLLVLASGPASARDAVQPTFDAIGRRTIWLGPAGAGSRLKLVLNTWLAFEVEAAAEAAAVAERLGVPPRSLSDAVRDNPLASPFATGKLAKMQSGAHEAEFALAWALKDLRLMEETVGIGDAPVAAAITRRWEALVDRGLGALDVSAARLGLGTARGAPDGHSSETLTGRPRDEQHRGRREEQPEGGGRGDRAQ